MNSDNQNSNSHSRNDMNETQGGVPDILSWFSGVGGSIFRTTARFLRNMLPRVRNKYLRYRNEKKRMPKRKTKSRVYLLAGYTTKAHVDRRYTAIKVQHLIRKILLLCILIVIVVILYKWINPLGNTTELKQIVGIEKIDELAREDPFGTTISNNRINIIPSNVTPTVTLKPT